MAKDRGNCYDCAAERTLEYGREESLNGMEVGEEIDAEVSLD